MFYDSCVYFYQPDENNTKACEELKIVNTVTKEYKGTAASTVRI
jgi:hypothetical protein